MFLWELAGFRAIGTPKELMAFLPAGSMVLAVEPPGIERLSWTEINHYDKFDHQPHSFEIIIPQDPSTLPLSRRFNHFLHRRERSLAGQLRDAPANTQST